MHALVSSVLLQMSRLNPFRHNPRLHPPHRQPRQSRHRRRGKRRSVVGADRLRHPILAERGLKDRPSPLACQCSGPGCARRRWSTDRCARHLWCGTSFKMNTCKHSLTRRSQILSDLSLLADAAKCSSDKAEISLMLRFLFHAKAVVKSWAG